MFLLLTIKINNDLLLKVHFASFGEFVYKNQMEILTNTVINE